MNLKKLVATFATATLVAGGAILATALPASATDPGSSPDNAILVQSKDQADPKTIWTDGEVDLRTCQVTDTGVMTTPQSHREYKYERTVQDFKPQYHFRKFTHTKTREWIKGVPGQDATYEKFTWHDSQNAPSVAPPSDGWKSSGVTKDTKGSNPDVIQPRGEGHGSYFYYKTLTEATSGTSGHWSDWSAYDKWKAWKPETHTSWQDSDAALGVPAYHGGDEVNGSWYREWQERFDGQIRRVPSGTHVGTSDWLTSAPAGDSWTQIDERSVDDAPVLTYYAYTHQVENCAVPVVCQATGSWYSEDGVAPAVKPDGVVFTATGHKPGLDYRVPVTGNLQGWESLTYTATGSDQLFPRLVISSPTDDFTYKSLSFSGTNTITQDSVADQTGKSIKDMAKLWPHAVITSVGFSMNSGAPAGTTATLTSVTSPCITQNFIVNQPKDYVEWGTWSNPVVTCDNEAGDVVQQYRTNVYVTTEWKDGQWVEVRTEKATHKNHTVTQAEIDALDCAVVTPPTTEPTPPVVTPTTPEVTPTPTTPKATPARASGTLAVTGSDAALPLTLGALAVAGITGGILLLVRRRKA